MPVKCHFCETNTHGDHDKEQYPVCNRLFLTPAEALSLLEYENGDVHVFIASPMNMLVGADWSKKEIVKLLDDAINIEVADPQGVARKMSHGLSVAVNKNPQDNRFLKTNEEKLKAFEDSVQEEKQKLEAEFSRGFDFAIETVFTVLDNLESADALPEDIKDLIIANVDALYHDE